MKTTLTHSPALTRQFPVCNRFRREDKCWIIGMVIAVMLISAAPVFVQDARGQAAQAPVPGSSVEGGIQTGRINPAVMAIQESNPTTPVELIKAIEMLLAFKEPKLAGDYADRLLRMNLNANAKADLGDAVGPAMLLKIGNSTDIEPPFRQFIHSILTETRKRRVDSGRLKQLASKLVEPGFDRLQALAALHDAGPTSTAPILQMLTEERRAEQRTLLLDALRQLGNQAVPPLLAVLSTKDQQLKADVVAVLVAIGSRDARFDFLAVSLQHDASPRMLALATRGAQQTWDEIPPRAKSVRILYTAIRDYLAGRRRVDSDVAGMGDYWYWDDATKRLTVRRVREDALAAATATRIAQQLQLSAPSDRRLQRMHLLAKLETMKLAAGLDRKVDMAQLPEVTSRELGDAISLVDEVLNLAIERDHTAAAIGACDALAQLAATTGGNTSLLSRQTPDYSPLVRAAWHGDPRLRLAACRAIVALRPARQFRGASFVTAALKHAIANGGERRFIVADSRRARGQLLAGLLMENGFESDLFRNGSSAFLAATRSSEVEAAFISFTIDDPRIRETLHRWRNDPRTSRIPVGLIVDPKDQLAAQRLVIEDPLAKVFVPPRNVSDIQMRVDQLAALSGRFHAPPVARAALASEAMQLLATATERNATLFELSGSEPALERALYQSTLAAPAAELLGKMGTAKAQLALIDMASIPQLPVADRQAAAKAFRNSVQKHGTQLTIPQIQRQGERYGELADLDPATEEVLWSILEGIEQAARQRNANN